MTPEHKLNEAIKRVVTDPFNALKDNAMSDDKKKQGPLDGAASPIADERVDNVKTVVAGRQLSTYEDTTERTSPSPVYVKGDTTHEADLPSGDDADAQERAVTDPNQPNVNGPDADTSTEGLDNLKKDEDKK